MSHARDAAGFTLIEAIVAAGLLATAALGTAQLFALATAQNAVARQQLVMTDLCVAKIEDLAAGTMSAGDGVETIVEADRSYRRRWHLTEVPGFGSDAYAITIVVSPLTGAGGEVRLTSVRLPVPR